MATLDNQSFLGNSKTVFYLTGKSAVAFLDAKLGGFVSFHPIIAIADHHPGNLSHPSQLQRELSFDSLDERPIQEIGSLTTKHRPSVDHLAGCMGLVTRFDEIHVIYRL
jgi:hypothetical protein